MLKLSLQTGCLVFLGLNLNACLPKSIQGTLGKNNNSEFRATLPEKSVFGEEKLQVKIKAYQLQIKRSDDKQENCKDLDLIANDYNNQNLSANIVKSCAYKISLSIGETSENKFIAYYAGDADLSSEQTKDNQTNVTLKIFRTEDGKKAGFTLGERVTLPPAPGSTDLSIQVEMGNASANKNTADPKLDEALNKLTSVKGLTKSCSSLPLEAPKDCIMVNLKSPVIKISPLPFTTQKQMTFGDNQIFLFTLNQNTQDNFDALIANPAKSELFVSLEKLSLTTSGKLEAKQKAAETIK